MNRKQKIMNGGVWLLIVMLGVYILGYGVQGQPVKRVALVLGGLLSDVEFTQQKSVSGV